MKQVDRVRRTGAETYQVGDITVRVHRPANATGNMPAILWIHGGGYVIGSATQDDSHCARLATRHGAIVAAAEYRLAPEHPFPIPLDDCHDALVWLAQHREVDPARIAIAGASAGGGLAAALALLARDRQQVRPVLQALAYPMLDDRTTLRTDLDERHLRLWDNTSNRFGWRSYLGQEPGSSDVSHLGAPARADVLSDLPPAWIGVGTLDLFHDEDVAYAARLVSAGVTCELHVVEGVFHAFDMLVPRSGVAEEFRASQDEAFTRAFAL